MPKLVAKSAVAWEYLKRSSSPTLKDCTNPLMLKKESIKNSTNSLKYPLISPATFLAGANKALNANLKGCTINLLRTPKVNSANISLAKTLRKLPNPLKKMLSLLPNPTASCPELVNCLAKSPEASLPASIASCILEPSNPNRFRSLPEIPSVLL